MEKEKIAKIPEKFQHDGIVWIILKEDFKDSGGVFLYFHKSLGEEYEYDDWYETTEKAKEAAFKVWGVDPSAWISEEVQ